MKGGVDLCMGRQKDACMVDGLMHGWMAGYVKRLEGFVDGCRDNMNVQLYMQASVSCLCCHTVLAESASLCAALHRSC